MDALVSVGSRNTDDILDARRRVAAKTVSSKFYTLDPRVLPNDIAAELFALLLKNSSDALSFLFWRTLAAVKRFTRQKRGKKTTENSAQETVAEASSLLFSVFKTVSAQDILQIDWFSASRKRVKYYSFEPSNPRALSPEIRKAWRTHATCTKYCKYQ